MAPWMIGAPFVAVGLVMTWIGLRFFARDRAMARWPRADGVVLSSGIDETTQRYQDSAGYWRDFQACVPHVRYTYTVAGNVLEGSRISRLPFSLTRTRARRLIDRYPPQQAVKVFYDPKEPKSSVLETKVSVGAVILGAFGGFMLLLGIGLVVLTSFV